MVTIYYLYVEPCHQIYGRKRTVKIKSELNRIEKYDSVLTPHVRKFKTVLDSGFHLVDTGFQVLE